jgi:hypothetical protein
VVETSTMAWAELDRLRLLPVAEVLEEHLAAEHHDRLVLLHVILEREALALLHVEDLAHVAGRLRPDELVPPGLVDDAAHARLRGRNRKRTALSSRR